MLSGVLSAAGGGVESSVCVFTKSGVTNTVVDLMDATCAPADIKYSTDLNLRTNTTLRTLCGWENSSEVPSEATFSRVFASFAEQKICNKAHAKVIEENYTDKLFGHANLDSTQYEGWNMV